MEIEGFEAYWMEKKDEVLTFQRKKQSVKLEFLNGQEICDFFNLSQHVISQYQDGLVMLLQMHRFDIERIKLKKIVPDCLLNALCKFQMHK